MQRAIMLVMAVGVALGGIDRLLGNRFGFGKKFDEGFMLLGPTALSMAGILCLMPVLTGWMAGGVSRVYRALRLDPAMFAGILAIDMGGYPMAMTLADDPAVGRFSGIIVGAIFGCTISFTIPLGMGMLDGETKSAFSQGILYGLIVMPLALILGGVLCGLSPLNTLWQLTPVIVLSLALLWGIRQHPVGTTRVFRGFAISMRWLITIGLILGAVQYMTGFEPLPGLLPLEEAMTVVSGIGIVLLGSLPMSEVIIRLLRRPLEAAGEKLGLNSVSMAGLLLSFISVMPVLAMMKDMDHRGKVVNAAAFVCTTAALAAHLGYTTTQEPALLPAVLVSKLVGGILAVVLSLLMGGRNEKNTDQTA